MSDTHIDPEHTAEHIRAIHEAVCSSAELDHSFLIPMSNYAKMEAVCAVTYLAVDDFDVMIDFPLRHWANSDELDLLHAGFYLSSLRWIFLCMLRDNAINPPASLSTMIEECKFWYDIFNEGLARQRDGNRPTPVPN